MFGPYSAKELKRYPQLCFWQEMFDLGWRTPPGYGPSLYQEHIPNASGVYLFALIDVSFDRKPKPVRIAYVGQSRNLLNRHKNHDIYRLMQESVSPYVGIDTWFKIMEESELKAEEIRLIRKYNPPFNIQHRVRGLQ